MSGERYHSRKNKYAFTTFGISLNLFILYILFPVTSILWATEFFFGVFVILSSWALYQRRLIIKKTYKNIETTSGRDSFLDNITLAKSYVWSNKRYILGTSLGLIIALSVITQAMVVSSTYQQSAFNDYIANDDPTTYLMRFTYLNESVYAKWQAKETTGLSSWFGNSTIKPIKDISEGNVEFRIILSTDKDWTDKGTGVAAHYQTIFTHTITPEILNLYSQLPSFPNIKLENQTLLILPPQITRVGIMNPTARPTWIYPVDSFITSNSSGNYFKILVNQQKIFGLHGLGSHYSFHNITYSVDQVWQLTEQDLAYIKSHDLVLPADFSMGTLYMPSGSEWDLFHQLVRAQLDGKKSPYIWGSVGFSTSLFVNLPKIKDMPLIDQLQDLQKSENYLIKVQSNFALAQEPENSTFHSAYYLETPLISQMEVFNANIHSLLRILLLFSLPMIMVSIFLLYFSLASIENKKERIFAQLKIRGISPNQIRVMILIEVLFSASIASIVAIEFGLLLSRFLITSSGIFQFNNSIAELSYNISLIWRILILGILLSLSLNLPNLNKFPNIDIEDSINVNSQAEPFWIKHNFDLITFLLCVAYWLSAFYLPITIRQGVIFGSFGGAVLLITVFAIPMVTGRYFLRTLAFILQLIKFPFDSMNMAVKNLITHKEFTTQLVAVLTAAMMLSFTGMIITNTVDHQNMDIAKYQLGADIVVDHANYTNPYIRQAIDVPHVVAMTNVGYVVKQYGYTDLPSGLDPHQFPEYHILGVNASSFLKAAYWKQGYSNGDLQSMFNQIEGTNGVLMSVQGAASQHLKIGDTFNFYYGIRGIYNLTLQLVGTFNYFPRLVTEIPSPNKFGDYELGVTDMVMSLSILNSVVENNWIDTTNVPLTKAQTLTYIKTDGTDPSKIILAINQGLLKYTDDYVITDYQQTKTSTFDILGTSAEISGLEAKMTYLTMHSILIFTALINIFCIALFDTIFLTRRKKELGIYRALGMTRRQTTQLILLEILLVLFTSIIIGIISGVLLAFIAFRVLLGNLDFVVPPFTLAIPYLIMIAIASLFFVIAIVLSIFTSLSTTRKQTGNILRAA